MWDEIKKTRIPVNSRVFCIQLHKFEFASFYYFIYIVDHSNINWIRRKELPQDLVTNEYVITMQKIFHER